MEKIKNPPIPYLGHIVGNFTKDKTVAIEGLITPPAQRVVITFQTGKNVSHKDDVALQLSARLLEGKVARNSLINGTWGTEEIEGNYPLTVGKKFTILVKNEGSVYTVTINGNLFTYRHRLPGSRVNHLAIQGDAKLYMIAYETNTSAGDNFHPLYDEPPPPYTRFPPEEQPTVSVLETAVPALAVGVGLGALGTALFSSGSSKKDDKCGLNCQCAKCNRAREHQRQQEQQQQQSSSGWGTFGAGLATAAAIGAVGGLLYSLIKDDDKNEDSD